MPQRDDYEDNNPVDPQDEQNVDPDGLSMSSDTDAGADADHGDDGDFAEEAPTTMFPPMTTPYENDTAYSAVDYDEFFPEYRWDNIPAGYKSPDGEWITRDRYEHIYGELNKYGIENANYSRNYSDAYQQNQQLRDANNRLTREQNQAQNEIITQRNSLDEQESELAEREEDLARRERKHKVLFYSAIAASVLLFLTSLILLILYLGERNESANANSATGVQTEQVNSLKMSLDQARREHSQAVSENQDLKGRVDALNQQVSDSQKTQEELQKQVGDKDRELGDLNKQVEELMEVEPETRTVTETAREQADTVTVTEEGSPGGTVTSTVTETATETPTP